MQKSVFDKLLPFSRFNSLNLAIRKNWPNCSYLVFNEIAASTRANGRQAVLSQFYDQNLTRLHWPVGAGQIAVNRAALDQMRWHLVRDARTNRLPSLARQIPNRVIRVELPLRLIRWKTDLIFWMMMIWPRLLQWPSLARSIDVHQRVN